MTGLRTSTTRLSSRRSAFSLIELMIAVVILGFGMVLVATMFPVGWVKARGLTDTAARLAMIENGESQLALTAIVDGGHYDANTFAGDLYIEGNPAFGTFNIVSLADTRVHALHAENRLMSGGRPISESPCDSDRLDQLAFVGVADPCDIGKQSGYRTPRVPFHTRFYPPMEAFPDDGSADPPIDPRWEKTLDTRHHAWAALTRLRKQVGPVGIPPNNPAAAAAAAEAAAALGQTRVFDIYIVSLRRSRSTMRYPQQDTAASKTPSWQRRDVIVTPAALDADQDTVIPTPWRLQVSFDPATLNSRLAASGVPTEIQVPPPGVEGDFPGWVVDFFTEGSSFVDEITGQVYRVDKRRIVQTNDRERAFLTLDREVFLEDLDDGELPNQAPPMLQPDETLRCVWLYPPPVTFDRPGEDGLAIDGPSPVLGIDVRTLHVSPKSE
jgi:prepilin-type N-terminal cleavage/methylation domain-containing protein